MNKCLLIKRLLWPFVLHFMSGLVNLGNEKGWGEYLWPGRKKESWGHLIYTGHVLLKINCPASMFMALVYKAGRVRDGLSDCAE